MCGLDLTGGSFRPALLDDHLQWLRVHNKFVMEEKRITILNILARNIRGQKKIRSKPRGKTEGDLW